MTKLKGVGIGAGYFSGFQYEAWQRIPETEISAMCNSKIEKARPIMEKYDVPKHYTDYKEMLLKEKPDFVDIITPPETHLEMCKFAADLGIDIICQKPLAPTLEESQELVDYVKSKGVRFVVHENFRFQPWYRKIGALISDQSIGNPHTINFRSRMGDGWGQEAYIPRQPYFREYPRFLVYENGIHFIDTFRFLMGEIDEVYAILRKLNPVIKGEDCGQVIFKFKSGAVGIWDANRYNEPNYESPRYTFGECLLEGEAGSLRLAGNGDITVAALGESEENQAYNHKNIHFASDCVYLFQRHFVDCMISGDEFESHGDDYLENIKVQEAIYESAKSGIPVKI